MSAQNVLVIGATSAIAQAIARKLAERGSSFVLWGRSEEKLELVAKDLRVRGSGDVSIKAFDFNDLASHAPALDDLAHRGNQIDLALVCHGVLGNQTAGEMDFGKATEILEANCVSTLSFLTLLANYFEHRKCGCIAVLSSVAGDRGRRSNYIYGTAKAAVNTFLQGLRARLYPCNVQVVTVKPGFVDTPMTSNLPKNFLFASPQQVAHDVVRGIDRHRCVVYTPWFWRYIMLILRLIPERVFRRLRL
jgi:short-subunit dehydrogenase